MTPKEVEAAVEESRDAGFDGGGLFLEVVLAGREKKNQLRVGKNFEPFDGVVGVGQDIAPYTVFERCQLAPRCFGTVAQYRDARRNDVVEGEGDGRGG